MTPSPSGWIGGVRRRKVQPEGPKGWPAASERTGTPATGTCSMPVRSVSQAIIAFGEESLDELKAGQLHDGHTPGD